MAYILATDWKWCGIIQAEPGVGNVAWSFGASVYTNPPSRPSNSAVNPAPATGTCAGGDDAGNSFSFNLSCWF
jgi:hypothetical protein